MCEGVVTGEEMKKLNEQLYATDDCIASLKYQLCDFLRVEDVVVNSEEIAELARQDERAAAVNPNMLIALVADQDLVFGLSRMWEAYADGFPLETMVFRSLDEARAWIEETLAKRS